MAFSTPGVPDRSSKDLLDDWNFGEEPSPEGDSLDSLLAFSDRKPRARLDTLPAPGRAQDSEILRGFTLGTRHEEGGDELEGCPEIATQPRDTTPSLKPKPGEALPVVLPKPGDVVGRFLIVGELGRGAFARVYLAKQEDLGQRLVALKVSRAEGDEPQILARLQHTHIVPIHSVHDDVALGMRLMCMPFLGGANLAQVLEATGAHLPEQTTGRSLVEALDVVSNRLQSATGLDESHRSLRTRRGGPLALSLKTPDSGLNPSGQGSVGALQSLWTRISGRSRAEFVPAAPGEEPELDQPARQFLRGANSIEAAVWIIARLAEGLDHAHSRGLLHRDLKPSNVLIAGDGTPMLLDFNLATLTRIEGSDREAEAMIGGTLPYMSPEHLDAFSPRGTTAPEAVDERSDLYSLGLILYEMIAGEHPFPEPAPTLPLNEIVQSMIDQRRHVPSLRAVRSDVPWSLDALAAKCLDPDPRRRYARARDLAEDLRRFLDDLPLKYTPEPSLRERTVKWARRHPQLCSTTSIALLSILLVCASAGIITLLVNGLQSVSARLKYRTFQSAFSECQLLLNTTSGPVEHLTRGIALAEKMLDRQDIGTRGELRRGSWILKLAPDEEKLVREQVGELILLEAQAKTYLANKQGSEADQRQALSWAVDWLRRAEKLDPRPTAALYGDRARYLAALGHSDLAADDRRRQAATKPESSRDFAMLGTSLLLKGERTPAEIALGRAVSLDPRRFWAWFLLGQCHFQQGRFLEAAGDFSVCTALEPRFAWPYMNRGLALAYAGRRSDARAAYDRALEENPNFAEALVNRSLVRLETNDPAGAESDLNRAIALGRDEPGVMAARGEVLVRLGRRNEAEQLFDTQIAKDPENPSLRIARASMRLKNDPIAARSDLTHVLERSPRDARALFLMALLVRADDPKQALSHVEAALAADPIFVDALQLRALLRARLGQRNAIDDAERLVKIPTPDRLYNAACAFALLTRSDHDPRLETRAFDLLGRALEAGYSAAQLGADPDWAALRDRPEYRALVDRFDKNATR